MKAVSARLQNYNYSSPGIYFLTLCAYRHNKFFGKIENNQMQLSKMGEIAQRFIIEIPNHFPQIKIDEFIVMPNHIHLLVTIPPVVNLPHISAPSVRNFPVETPYMASKLKTNSNSNNKSIFLNSNSILNSDETPYLASNSISLNSILIPNETPYMASLQDNRPIKLIKYSHQNHPDFYPRLNQISKQLIPKIIQQYKSAVTRTINPKTIFFAWQSLYYDIIIKTDQKYQIVKNYIINNPVNWQKDKFYI